MRLRHGLLAAALLAVISTGSALAAGLFNTLPETATVPQQGCIPTDVYGPSVANSQGVNPATVCLTPGQISGQASGNALSQYANIPIGSVAYGSLGTDTTPTAGTIYRSSIRIPTDVTLTSIACLNGSAAATDTLIYALYDSSGNLVANTSLSGTTATGTNAFQAINLASSYLARAGLYYVAYQASGTTTRIRTVAASTFLGLATSSTAGVTGTIPSTFTVPTTFTANVGPICYVDG